MTFDDFFEIVDSSLKRMAAPIAVIATGFILAKETLEGHPFLGLTSNQWLYTSIAFGCAYVFAIVFVGCRKINQKTESKICRFIAKFIYSAIFLFTSIGAASLAISKAI